MLVLLGESGSGKSTLQNLLLQSDMGYSKIVTYTTRPKRPGEIDGVDYHFVSEQFFKELVRAGYFVETMQYRDWHYGTAKKDCVDGDNKVIVMNPPGLRALRRCGIDSVSVYLSVDRASRLIKMIQRGDNIEEAYRRNITDVGQFNGVKDEVDYVIENDGYRLDETAVLVELITILKPREVQDETD